MQAQYVLTRAEYERELDAAIDGSFPASDPPPWTFGASPWMDMAAPIARRPVPAAIDVIFRDGRRVGGIRLASLGEAVALAATVPLAILIAGVVASAIAWLIGGG